MVGFKASYDLLSLQEDESQQNIHYEDGYEVFHVRSSGFDSHTDVYTIFTHFHGEGEYSEPDIGR